MNLWFRFTWVFLNSIFRKVSNDHAFVSRIHFRVMPSDCDVNMHMTNSRYLSFMDLGRVHFLLMTPLRFAFWKGRWRPIVAGAMVKYYKSLKPLQGFELVTKLMGHDLKFVYMEQRVEVEGQTYAQAYFRGLFRNQLGHVPPAEVMRAAGRGQEPMLTSHLTYLFSEMDRQED